MKFISILFLIFLFTSCSRTRQEPLKEIAADASAPLDLKIASEITSANTRDYSELAASQGGVDQSENQIIIQPKIIKEGYLTLKVENYTTQKIYIQDIIKKFRGYISTENEINTIERIENTFSIRVDAVAFDSLIAEMEKIAIKVDSRSVQSQDVTEEYIDVEARIKTKKIYEQKYFDLLKQANKVSEIIELQNQLKMLREEIESMEGRMRYLNNKIAMSTLNLTIYQSYDFKYESQGNGFWYRDKSSLAAGWDSIQNTFFFAISNWNWWVLFFAIYIFYKWFRKK